MSLWGMLTAKDQKYRPTFCFGCAPGRLDEFCCLDRQCLSKILEAAFLHAVMNWSFCSDWNLNLEQFKAVIITVHHTAACAFGQDHLQRGHDHHRGQIPSPIPPWISHRLRSAWNERSCRHVHTDGVGVGGGATCLQKGRHSSLVTIWG